MFSPSSSLLPVSLLIALGALGALLPAAAQAASADQLPDIQHTVQAGDTLEAVAKRYLKDPQQWRELGEANAIKQPKHLPVGSVIVIPARLVGYQNVTVAHVQGAAQSRSPQTGDAWQALAKGATLTEGDELQVPAGSFVTLAFADGSTVRINEKSALKLSELRKNTRTNEQQSVVELNKGGLESHVTPTMEQRRKRKFEIKTPMATTSVRGTVFSVSLSDAGNAITAVDQGTVAVAGSQAKREAAVHAGSGIAVQQDGQLGGIVDQLAAPSLQGNPAVFEDADFLTLKMAPVPQAAHYQVVLAQDAGLSAVLRSQRFASPTAKFEGVEDGSYFVSARALDAQDIPGKPTVQAIKVKATPVPPLYSSPAPNGLIGTDDGELLCTEGGKDIAGYRIQVAATADFARPLVDTDVTDKCKSTISQLGAGSYFWRAASVRKLADGSLDQGPFAKPQAFKAGANPATLTADDMRAAEITRPDQLQLSWPGEPGQAYNLQLARNEQFNEPLSTEKLNEPHWTSGNLSPGQYFVRIQVLDPSGLKSKYSAPRKLSIDPVIITGNGTILKAGDGKLVQRQH